MPKLICRECQIFKMVGTNAKCDRDKCKDFQRSIAAIEQGGIMVHPNYSPYQTHHPVHTDHRRGASI